MPGPAKCINCGVSTNNHRFRCDWLHCTMMRKVADFPSPRAPEKPSSSHVTEDEPSANGIRVTVMSHVLDSGQVLLRRNNHRGIPRH
ncbi:hypothetical protein BD311DRAFT_777012 [Dichomitus squalens]|uniref:Uncharacterized protein n=1 Tax=Dichomitus squalens TaxID=114155 RepID=A0A4Q9MRS6_9APHY|nr:hypothetical protein BD311DRAFT_777012 [Dichomitus squalens]TBU56934.1 hypothetical protein BD310DRAFT_949801 [Dichomitus squalens]